MQYFLNLYKLKKGRQKYFCILCLKHGVNTLRTSSKFKMAYNSRKINIMRSKSTGALNLLKDNHFIHCNGDYFDDIHTQSDFSLGVSETSAGRSCSSFDDHLDCGFINVEPRDTSQIDTLSNLELKVVKLGEILQEQHHLFQELKEEVVYLETLIPKKANQTVEEMEELFSVSDKSNTNNSAKVLLDAIELKHEQQFEFDMKNVLKEFLRSDDLKNHLALTAVERIREVINQCLSETFQKVYLPFLERSHRRLLTHVSRTLHNAFHELEENSYFLYKTVHKSSRSLRYAIERHQYLLESNNPATFFSYLQNNLETVLRTELTEWSNKLLKVLTPLELEDTSYEEKYNDEEITLNSPVSPPQPADPERSIIDQLMKSAQINKQIQNGEINKAFESALSSADLSLVMAACRAACPRHVFEPCVLQQPVLLALIQQLATDMVHDTQLKCRYLEDALIKLDLSNQATREHLPLMVGEIRKHLSKFLQSYPSHVASRRITLIIMAADNLLNY